MSLEKDRYFIDPESTVEMARLLEQDRLVTGDQAIPEIPLETLLNVGDVLDIACGPGGWALELARQHPHIRSITGIDISHRMITFANQLADAEKLSHVHFQEMDVHNLSFSNASFDLINLRFISGFMLRGSWKPLVENCKQLLRPGGILRLTECDSSISNNVAQNEMAQIVIRGMYQSGRGFNPVGTMGIVNMLPFFLRQAKFHDIAINSKAIDVSNGLKDAKPVQQNFTIALALLEPFLLQLHLLSKEEFDNLIEKIKEGWKREDHTEVWLLLTAWGIK